MEQNQHLELGKINTLQLDRLTTPGAYLLAKDGNDVLLPGPYLTNDMREGELINVFLYTDSEDRLVATTKKPRAMLDEFAMFEVVDIAPFGAFVDWVLPKDLLVPKKLQKTPFVLGEKRFLKVAYDEKTHRLVGTEKLGEFFDKKVVGMRTNQEVTIVVVAKTPLGYKVLVENKYEGLIYHNEIFEKIEVGDNRVAFVKRVRKDGNIDLSLRKIGNKNSDSSTQRIVTLLEQNNGILPYNYKSDAELVKEIFAMSKKEYKRSLTSLIDSKTIEVKDSGIYLLKR